MRTCGLPYKKLLLTIFILINFSVTVTAQRIATGKVLTEENNPVAGATVFISNTSNGTETSSDGSFKIKLPTDRHQLVVFSPGFSPQSTIINSDQAIDNLLITLQPTADPADAVYQIDRSHWRKHEQWFRDQLLGTSDYASSCVIQNPEVLRFLDLSGQNIRKVIALAPLIIDNKKLGYRLTYQLEELRYDYVKNQCQFSGFALFKDLEGSDKEKKRWEEARYAVYKGSLMHFMRSLYAQRLPENGFEVRRLEKRVNEEKKKLAESMYRGFNVKTSAPSAVDGYTAENHRRLLEQDDTLRIFSNHLLSGDSIAKRIDSATTLLEFNGYLAVSYFKAETADEFQRQFPFEDTKQQSEMLLWHRRPVMLASSGAYYPPADLLIGGYWGWREKLATLLPNDYQPPRN